MQCPTYHIPLESTYKVIRQRQTLKPSIPTFHVSLSLSLSRSRSLSLSLSLSLSFSLSFSQSHILSDPYIYIYICRCRCMYIYICIHTHNIFEGTQGTNPFILCINVNPPSPRYQAFPHGRPSAMRSKVDLRDGVLF